MVKGNDEGKDGKKMEKGEKGRASSG